MSGWPWLAGLKPRHDADHVRRADKMIEKIDGEEIVDRVHVALDPRKAIAATGR